MTIYRARINQPSTLQPRHDLDGKRCIVHDTGDQSVTVYFTEGPLHSTTVLRQCISRIYLSSAQTA